MSARNSPPSVFLRFFRWYCNPRLRNHIEGDLTEVYNDRITKIGRRKADLKFIIDVMMLFRPAIIKPFARNRNLNNYSMYQSYFKIGWRNLWKNKGYSLINIGGLALGISIALMIMLWVSDELQFNHYHKNHGRMARVMRNATLNGETFTSAFQPVPLAEALRTKYPTLVKSAVNAWIANEHILADVDRKATFKGTFIEPEGIRMLSLRLESGAVAGFDDPSSILISASTAKNLFGEAQALNNILSIDNGMEAKVVGVYEDIPYNSSFHDIHFFAPWQLLVSVNPWLKHQNFENNMLEVYVECAEDVSFDYVSSQIKDVILNEANEGYAALQPQLFLHPMDDWHLRDQFKNGKSDGGLIEIVWLFGIVGAFVLLLACINFMNLSTARSEKRAKEVGIRKSMGSFRIQLMNQFFSESLFIVMLSFVVSLIIISVCLPWFNDLAGKSMTIPWGNGYVWLTAVAFVITTGLIAGSYPALYMSSFSAVSVLKGKLRMGKFAAMPRKVLVVFQFTVSITLIVGTIVVYQQIQFAKDRPTGYSREKLIMVQMSSPELRSNVTSVRNELEASGVVAAVAESTSPPTDIWNSNGGFDWKGKDPDYQAEFSTLSVTASYGKTLGWEFIKGRDFSPELASDSSAFVINEAAAKVLGFEDPVGEIVKWNAIYQSNKTEFTVIGVIRDMVIKSPYDNPKPAVYFIGYNKNWINIKIKPTVPMTEAIDKMEKVFAKVVPAAPFDFKFVDDEYARKFNMEERVGKLTSLFTTLALVISCLGLFGLASFVAEQKTKEIGIRKVVGASVFSLWKLLSVDFIILVTIACCIAIPTGYYMLSQWLYKFDYHTEVSWTVFAVTVVMVFVITLLTVSYQAVNAALANPVKSLRSE